MKLTIKRHELKLASSWKVARGSKMDSFITVVAILDDESGMLGFGEGAPISRYKESAQTIESFLSKLNPDSLSFNDLDSSNSALEALGDGNTAAKCAINTALIDGAAKLARRPVYDFLGLGFTEGRHYTSFSIGIDAPSVVEQKVASAERFPIVKIKLGVPEDREIFAALKRVAPTKTIRVDANEGWKTKEAALDAITWLAQQGGVEFVEQPMPASISRQDWTWLKARSPLPIFADESFHTAEDANWCADCFHGVNVKLVKTGGFSGAFAALRAARRQGLQTMIGCMIETSVLISAAAHLSELADYLDLDGNLLVVNDPYVGVETDRGVLSFEKAGEPFGARVQPRIEG